MTTTSILHPYQEQLHEEWFVDEEKVCKSAGLLENPVVLSRFKEEQTKNPSIKILSYECLFEIFRRLQGSHEKIVAACVSK